MRLNADFSQPVTIRPADYDWRASPSAGVERMMLDRIGDEVARATTIVRFAPGSRFAAHTHGGGEEFLVLDGTFSDETGDFPVGTYVRNPIGTSHTPHTDPGCTILVKLHQFAADDSAQIAIDTNTAVFTPGAAGTETLPLHRHGPETVTLHRLAPGAALPPETCTGGAEAFVIEGVLDDATGPCPAGSWLRRPPGATLALASTPGCLVWLKTGHLADA